MSKRTLIIAGLIVVLSLILVACGGAEATPEVVEPTEVNTDVPPTAGVTEEATVEPTAELTTLVAPNPTAVASGNTPQEQVIAANIEAADVARGEDLFNRRLVPMCSECHVEDASVRTQGPALTNFRDVAGTRIEGQDAYTYAYNSIRYANDFVIDGFEADVMRVYDGILDDRDVYDLIAYIWTLGEE